MVVDAKKAGIQFPVLLGKFCYLEAVMLDTPLHDAKARSYIGSQYPEGQKALLINRLLAVQRFVDILGHLEARERIRVASADLDTVCPPVMPTVGESIKAEIDLIKNSDAWKQQEY